MPTLIWKGEREGVHLGVCKSGMGEEKGRGKDKKLSIASQTILSPVPISLTCTWAWLGLYGLGSGAPPRKEGPADH